LASDFGAGVQEQDLSGQPDKAAAAINSWVSGRTAGHINRLVTPDEVAGSAAVLVDAVYLNALWATPFNSSDTAPGPFHVSSGRTLNVPMMWAEMMLAASAGSSLDAVELPYRGGHLSALVLMPPLGQLASFESKLTVGGLDKIVSGLKAQSVDLNLPKFSLTSGLQLNKVLAAMGMGQAFGASANFSNVSPRGLQVSFVVHSAQIKVAENGTEASAASASGLAGAVAPVKSISIVVNHPFLFVVRDNATGCILFEAQVTDPAAS
jgi:serpin B